MFNNLITKVKKYLEEKEIESAYSDFVTFGYHGLTKRQHEIIRKQSGLYSDDETLTETEKNN